MADSTRDSDRIMAAARRSLVDQRKGGRRSIGQGSAQLRATHRKAKLTRMLMAVFAIVIAAMGVGLFVGALGFEGLFVTILAIIVAIFVLSKFPRLTAPTRDTLDRGNLQQNVARTELWLEAQRPMLPAPAIRIIDQIGLQLDGLSEQLQHVPANTPSAADIRRLVTEHLPQVVSSYSAIPQQLRSEEHGGATPHRQLEDGLTRISSEIDRVTRQLAEGALDDLAVRTRFLDYRYGDELTPPGEETDVADTGARGLLLTQPKAGGTDATQIDQRKPD
ncbi:hypothetical protein RM533_11570 [Croceicoccus sp. F390]|uniref:5-bromo-4-chloroindolyl phosphate hydrolysis protein n=1 Tax=Croceicoccus esteveae TaxID=3075597 RepID=A0ABU2ZMZ6_9SPHN|nr:hypothetical protein [Croceicoccus sp. F390]MDT0576812.1 hypothetical protein [Croceicoccus sp. F390]